MNLQTKNIYQTKKLLAFIMSVNSSVIMAYYWQNKLLKISSVIICILPMELSLQKITSNFFF